MARIFIIVRFRVIIVRIGVIIVRIGVINIFCEANPGRCICVVRDVKSLCCLQCRLKLQTHSCGIRSIDNHVSSQLTLA